MVDLNKAMQRAVYQIAQIFNNKYKLGKEMGQIIASAAIVAPVAMVIKKQIDRHRTVDINLTKHQDIHAHPDHGVNTSTKGHLVGAVYQGDDGNLYKLADGSWWEWDGSNWI